MDPRRILPLIPLALAWAAAQAATEAEPRPRFDLVPGVVIDHSPASSGLYIGSPSLAVLPNGDYVASHDFFGTQSSEFTEARSAVFGSHDRGQLWRKVSEIEGAFWSSLFVHRSALYLLGLDRHHGNILIRRSTDGGQNWTSPTNAATGLLRDNGEYHCAPMPVIEHHGRLWRAFEWRHPPAAWGINYCAGVLSAPVDADLLNAASWTASNFLPSDRAWNDGDMGAWLEGNAVVTPKGALVDVLRVQTRSPDEKAAIVSVSADGKTAVFDPATSFVSFPGGAKKFAIRFDAQSKLYWSLASIVLERHRAPNPGGIRNTLALTCSLDLTSWTVRRLLLYHPDVAKHGFQYVDWLFDGEDIIAVCRTAYDDGLGGAHNNHDANFLTFHRFANFRANTRADRMPESAQRGDTGLKMAEAAATAVKSAKVLLAVLAHPDDETVCAGTLARAAAAGWDVRVIFATSGDRGTDVSGQNLKGAALGREREREGTNALTALGVTRPPIFLGFGDGTLAQAKAQVTERLVKELAGFQADVVLTFGPDGFTRHRDHIAVGAATDEAVKQASPSSAVYHAVLGRQLEGWAKAAGAPVPAGTTLPENLVNLDVQAFQAQRLAGLRCHQTQWPPEVQTRLIDFRKAYPFEEFLWAGGAKGAPGKWVGP